MAKTTNTADPRRVADIAAKIQQACGSISGDHADMLDAQEQVQALSGKMQNTRLSVATSIAAMSHAEGWTSTEVDEACAAAVKGLNSSDSTAKTVGVFISEMRTFASPKVRAEFPTTLDACQEAWAAEQEDLAAMEPAERKGADTPVRKFKQRLYHLVMDVARQIKKGELSVDGPEDVVRYCRENDPDFDAAKIAKRLAKIVSDLDAVFTDFGMGAIQTAAEYLRTIKPEELLASRKLLLGGSVQPVAYTAPAPTQAPVSTPQGPQDDILDDEPAYDPEPLAAPVEPAVSDAEPAPAVAGAGEAVADVPMAAQGEDIMPGAVDLDDLDELNDLMDGHARLTASHAAGASVMAEAA